MKRILPFVVISCLTLLAVQDKRASAQDVAGHLVIIGGGDDVTPSMKRFIDLAGGPAKARIIVLPMASSIPDTVGMEKTQEFKDLGVRDVRWILFDRTQAETRGFSDTLNGATGIFFSGGDQVKLTGVIVGTPVLQRLKELRRKGVVIAGTSAGAAIMSRVMITGNELINKDTVNIFTSIRKRNVETLEGMGFLNNVIIDQHFIKRKRLNRLISVVLEHPELPGLGIDEPAGIDVSPDGTFEVLAGGTVVVVDARHAQAIHSDPAGNLAGRDLRLHILTAGERFDPAAGVVLPSK